MRLLRTIVALTAAAYAVGAPAEALRGAGPATTTTAAAAVAPAADTTTEGSGAVINPDGSATFTFPGVSVPKAEADGAADVAVAPATPANKQAFAGEEREPRDVAKEAAAAAAGGPVVNADGSATFTFPSVGVKVIPVVAAPGTVTAKQAFAGEEETRNNGDDNKAAWAGEEEPRISGDKAAFAGIDDHFRMVVNTVRISDGVAPLAAAAPLKLAAFKMAQDLAAADSATLDEKVGGKDVLQRAKDEGFQGTAVQALLHTEDAAVARDVKDREGAVLSAATKWTASKDATAAIDVPTHKYVGSMGYLSASGRAYYVTLLGK